jgi:hypothetical protein
LVGVLVIPRVGSTAGVGVLVGVFTVVTEMVKVFVAVLVGVDV